MGIDYWVQNEERKKKILIQKPMIANHLKVLFSKTSRGQNIKHTNLKKSITFENIQILNKKCFGALLVLFRGSKKCPFNFFEGLVFKAGKMFLGVSFWILVLLSLIL